MPTYGPFHGSNASSGGGGAGWTNPTYVNNVTFSPFTYFNGAAGASDVLSVTTYDAASNFGVGFAIPSGETIIGIALDIRRWEQDPSGMIYPGEIADSAVHIITTSLGASPTNKAAAGNWPRSDDSPNGIRPIYSYGGPTDLWGFVGLMPADVNDSSFGFTFEALGDGFSNSGRLWGATLTVWTDDGVHPGFENYRGVPPKPFVFGY